MDKKFKFVFKKKKEAKIFLRNVIKFKKNQISLLLVYEK